MRVSLPGSLASRTLIVMIVGLIISHLLSIAIYTTDRRSANEAGWPSLQARRFYRSALPVSQTFQTRFPRARRNKFCRAFLPTICRQEVCGSFG